MIEKILPLLLMLHMGGTSNLADEFEAYKQKETADFRAYTEKMEREWKNYLADIEKNFGSIDLTSDKKWVSYSKNNRSRVSLDYDKGNVTIEFVADEKEKGLKEAKELLRKASTEVNPFSSAPVLEENVDPDRLDLGKAELVQGHIKGSKNVYRISVPLNEDRQENNEIQIAEPVRDMTEKYNVSYDLAMAIIKTESNFNVVAGTKKETLDIRNPDVYENNPWGLMQVVPSRSGREGLKRARGQDRMPAAKELLDPKLNLEIGVAYLSLLQDHYFDGVKNDRSREAVMIYAYREGTDKAYGAFSRKGTKREAVEELNRMTPEEVIARLAGGAGSKTAGNAASGQYLTKVEKERSNFRVDEKERKELEETAGKIVQKPELLAAVKGWLGTPYRLGSNSRQAIDCSAFTMNIYSEVYRHNIPRTSVSQYERYGRSAVGEGSRKEGDLIYFKDLFGREPVTHVGIWLDEHRFVHASSSKGVVISNLTISPYWKKRYVGANRPDMGK